MANNRLLLYCLRCKEDISIARLQVGMGSDWLPSRTPAAEYEAWLLKHSRCGDGDELGLAVGLSSENRDALRFEVKP